MRRGELAIKSLFIILRYRDHVAKRDEKDRKAAMKKDSGQFGGLESCGRAPAEALVDESLDVARVSSSWRLRTLFVVKSILLAKAATKSAV